MTKLRVCFAGTPEFAAAHLSALLAAQAAPEQASQFEVVSVYTQPDRPAGRGKKLTPSPVKRVAESAGLPVLQPASLRSEEAQAELATWHCDVLVVVAYGLILPQAILDTPRLGCINVHASLLPRWRGAAPIERALLAGDDESGVTIMQMDAGLDTGAMLLKAAVPIDPRETRLTLEAKLTDAGTGALVRALNSLEALRADAETQDDGLSTYARKIDKAEALIDWSLPAATIDLLVRASIGRNPAFTLLNGERVRLIESAPCMADRAHAAASPGAIDHADKHSFSVACGDGQGLRVTRVQLPGKSALAVSDVLNAKPDAFAAGTQFERPVDADNASEPH
jgi:methionyl-tRNA formyltransferase